MYIKTCVKGHFIIIVVYIGECIFVNNYLHLIFELSLILLQEKYLIKVLHKFNMMNCILFLTPMESNMKFLKI